jgi:hypothetical protein
MLWFLVGQRTMELIWGGVTLLVGMGFYWLVGRKAKACKAV